MSRLKLTWVKPDLEERKKRWRSGTERRKGGEREDESGKGRRSDEPHAVTFRVGQSPPLGREEDSQEAESLSSKEGSFRVASNEWRRSFGEADVKESEGSCFEIRRNDGGQIVSLRSGD